MRILLVEDDFNFSDILAMELRQAGFTVDTCDDGTDASFFIQENAYELILLDRMLPHVDGLTLLRQLRSTGLDTPVIILTALGELNDKIDGLDCGADDYLVKPFAFEELLARIRSIGRRPRKWNDMEVLSFGDITFSPSQNLLSGALGSCTLSKKEGSLMEFFIRNSNQTLPRNTLLTNVWGPDGVVEEGNLDNYMHFIRRRLGCVSDSVFIKTIRGVGYQMISTH